MSGVCVEAVKGVVVTYFYWLLWYRWQLERDSTLFNRPSMAWVWGMKRAKLSEPVYEN